MPQCTVPWGGYAFIPKPAHQRTQVKNQVHAILHKNGVRHEFSSIFGKTGCAWLDRLQMPGPFRTNLTEHLRTLDWFDQQIAAADARVEALVRSHPQAELLTTIPGVSFVSALTIIAEIGDIKRFRSPKKLMGYAGLVPSTHSSGEKTTHGRITKQGSKWLRWIMVEVAQKQQLCTKRVGLRPYFIRMKSSMPTPRISAIFFILPIHSLLAAPFGAASKHLLPPPKNHEVQFGARWRD